MKINSSDLKLGLSEETRKIIFTYFYNKQACCLPVYLSRSKYSSFI